MKIQLLAVPYDCGVRGVRMGAGPRRLLDAGLEERLADAGHEVAVEPIEAPVQGLTGEVQSMFGLLVELATKVRQATDRGALPVVLAGQCFTSVATTAGIGDRRIGVVWLDGHADFNTPETTVTGFLDGMAAATMTGRCWEQLCSAIPGFGPVSEQHLLWLGVRDMDPLEAAAVSSSGATLLPPPQIRTGLGPALAFLRERVSCLYVHVDLDVIDPSEGRANAQAASGGLTVNDAEVALARVSRTSLIAAITLSAYDPACDAPGKVCDNAFRLLDAMLSGREELLPTSGV